MRYWLLLNVHIQYDTSFLRRQKGSATNLLQTEKLTRPTCSICNPDLPASPATKAFAKLGCRVWCFDTHTRTHTHTHTRTRLAWLHAISRLKLPTAHRGTGRTQKPKRPKKPKLDTSHNHSWSPSMPRHARSSCGPTGRRPA